MAGNGMTTEDKLAAVEQAITGMGAPPAPPRKQQNFDPQRAVNLIGPAMEQTAQAAVVNIRQAADQCLTLAQSLKADADALADEITARVRGQVDRLNEFALTVQALTEAMQMGRERIEVLGSPKREH